MTATLLRPDTTDETRREFLALAAGLLALGATSCGDEDRDAAATSRTARTPRGPVRIPSEPRRVYAAYSHDFWNALALELPVVAGTGEYSTRAAVPDYIAEQFPRAGAVRRIPATPEIDVETVASVRPDVILSSIFGDGAGDRLYERLDRIAPTVTHRYSTGKGFELVPWRDVLRLNGEQFGRQRQAEAWIARFARQAADLRARLAADFAGATWAYVEPYPEQWALGGPAAGHIPATLVDELGLELAPAAKGLLEEADALSQGSASLSYERLSDLRADIIFVGSYVPPGEAARGNGIALLEAQPLWRRIPAVRDDRVYVANQSLFYDSGPTATAFLGFVERSLLA